MTGEWPGIDELRSMQREAIRPDGLRRLLSRVARSIDGHAALLDASGQPLHASPGAHRGLYEAAAEEIERIRSGQVHSVAAEHDSQVVVVLPTSHHNAGPLLVAAGERHVVLRAKELLADSARLLWLCWQVEEAGQARHRLDQADSRAREAVLQMLMLGDRRGAGRVAAALRPHLADPMRVYVAECEPRTGARDTLVTLCAEICDGRAWVVRCPVYTRHVIVLAPADDTSDTARGADGAQCVTDPIEDRFRAFALSRRDIRIGASQAVPLRDTAAGYEQAFHALAAAKSGLERYAPFRPREELAALLGESGRVWARQFLAPLVDYVPDRSHDPDAEELKITLEAWLNFYSGAARQLRIHRNTLSTRLRRIEDLFDCDARQIRTQATLHLALRILDYPRQPAPEDHQGDVDALLQTTQVRRWAQRQLAPLLTDDAGLLLTTLRAWLASDTRIDATAAALGISVTGTRKRLLRLEGTLERSVLNGPSARYDLWLALRINDGRGL